MKHLLQLKPHPNHKNHQSLQEKKSKGNKLPENKAKAFNTLRSKALNCSDSEVASTPDQIPNASTSLGFSFFPHHGMLNHVHCSSKKACSTQLPGRCFRCLQVKKGNKLYADDLTQLRSNPEDFQSEEEAADSASEVRGGCGLEKKD